MLSFIVALLVAPVAFADQKIAVLDIQKAIQTSDAGKKAKSELETAFNKKKVELQAEEVKLKKLQEDFQKQQAALNQVARQKKESELREKFGKYQELLQKSQQEIQAKEQEMSAPIITKIRNNVTEIAKKKGYSLVLEKNENLVLFQDGKDDLTDDVINSINK